jgi:hypothetical protein
MSMVKSFSNAKELKRLAVQSIANHLLFFFSLISGLIISSWLLKGVDIVIYLTLHWLYFWLYVLFWASLVLYSLVNIQKAYRQILYFKIWNQKSNLKYWEKKYNEAWTGMEGAYLVKKNQCANKIEALKSRLEFLYQI